MTPDPDDLTPLERRWEELAPPEAVESARALYELVPAWSNRNLPFVDVPYDADREQHWADAARVADYASHLPADGRTVVDIGPGDGWPALPLAHVLPRATVVGVDPAPRRTATCRANAERLGLRNAAFVTGDAAALPFADGTVDLVTASQSLEEADDPAGVFAEIARVLRPGGVLRASYQVWTLPVPEFETVALTQGIAGLIYAYSRRTQDPPRERRSVLVVPGHGPAAEAHRDALVASADAPRAYGETLLEHGSPLGVPLLEALAPHALRSMRVTLHRWTTPWLVEVLRDAGFREVRATVHSGDLARQFARRLRAQGGPTVDMARFESLTRALGEAAARQPGESMVTAVR